ncbi:hypothetical protein GPA_27370 [Gordonibacter pamelaeae 7-10-1-b]|uniref:Uncharacterized protein n=1 Tax=Gordonibacter pamelaeae 7-10-1-b TaxID=657308 RepID=D6EAM2_9ACTN|nr:hypothetical protein GPA_27370 [Gordonibacter pamelaeae 7-10-1-b]
MRLPQDGQVAGGSSVSAGLKHMANLFLSMLSTCDD